MTKAYNYIHKYGHKSKLMAAAVRNKQDLLSLLGYWYTSAVILDSSFYVSKKTFNLLLFYCSSNRVDYIVAPLKVLQSLKESVTSPDEKFSFVRRLSPQSAANYTFSDEEVGIQLQMTFHLSLYKLRISHLELHKRFGTSSNMFLSTIRNASSWCPLAIFFKRHKL